MCSGPMPHVATNAVQFLMTLITNGQTFKTFTYPREVIFDLIKPTGHQKHVNASWRYGRAASHLIPIIDFLLKPRRLSSGLCFDLLWAYAGYMSRIGNELLVQQVNSLDASRPSFGCIPREQTLCAKLFYDCFSNTLRRDIFKQDFQWDTALWSVPPRQNFQSSRMPSRMFRQGGGITKDVEQLLEDFHGIPSSLDGLHDLCSDGGFTRGYPP